jgi:tRNA dimethylallyltransferase
MNMKPLIVISGPTAVGKSDLAVSLAEILDTQVISCDAMQVYKGMDIGTAKITADEMHGIVHHLIDVVDPDEEMSTSIFLDKALAVISNLHDQNKTPILCGGSGLYIDSIVYDSYDFTPAPYDKDLRHDLEYLASTPVGEDFLFMILSAMNPDHGVHPNNTKRVIRYIEHAFSTEPTYPKEKSFRFNPTYYFCLNMDRLKMYERINRRVDLMMEKGFMEEVKSLYERGYQRNLPSMKAIGYQQLLEYLEGEITFEEAIDKIKQLSRNYAKRQLTWFRHNPEVVYINVDEENALERIITVLNLEGKGVEHHE